MVSGVVLLLFSYNHLIHPSVRVNNKTFKVPCAKKIPSCVFWLYRNVHSQKLRVQNIEYLIAQIHYFSIVTYKAFVRNAGRVQQSHLAPKCWQTANILQP